MHSVGDRVQGYGDFGFRVQSSGYGIYSLELRVWGIGFRVKGLGFEFGV